MVCIAGTARIFDGERVPVFVLLRVAMDGFGKMDGSHLVDEIFAHWNALWGKAATYDVLATLAYRCEPCKPFDWFDGISFLSDIERDALAQWSGGTNRSE